jgi:protein phosphatase
MIKVNNQNSISELGKRSNNEDNFGYIQGATYVVCDGVGGSDKGEIASEITVKTFIEAFKINPNADASEVLRLAESNITSYINKHEHTDGMATTLTFSQVRDNGIYIAWVGDSRVYQFRNGRIVFQTTDHSWINEALRSGILTAEEAIGHPKANVITRAIQGAHKPTTADKVLLTDIQKGDLFLHCSDGVLETWSDEDLSAVFASLSDPASILTKIKSECAQHSKDNFTAIVYQIADSNISTVKAANPTNYVPESIPIKNSNATSPSKGQHRPAPVSKKKGLSVSLILLSLAIPASIYLTSLYYKSKDKEGTTINNDDNNNKDNQKNKDENVGNQKNNEENNQEATQPKQNDKVTGGTNNISDEDKARPEKIKQQQVQKEATQKAESNLKIEPSKEKEPQFKKNEPQPSENKQKKPKKEDSKKEKITRDANIDQ